MLLHNLFYAMWKIWHPLGCCSNGNFSKEWIYLKSVDKFECKGKEIFNRFEFFENASVMVFYKSGLGNFKFSVDLPKMN